MFHYLPYVGIDTTTERRVRCNYGLIAFTTIFE
jgi:hypothetical protein